MNVGKNPVHAVNNNIIMLFIGQLLSSFSPKRLVTAEKENIEGLIKLKVQCCFS